MRARIGVLSTCCFCLALLAGCGDDPASEIGGVQNPLGGSDNPFAGGGNPMDALKGGTLKLTDAHMEKYVQLVREMKSASKRPDELWAKYQTNAQEWMRLSVAVGRAASSMGNPQGLDDVGQHNLAMFKKYMSQLKAVGNDD